VLINKGATGMDASANLIIPEAIGKVMSQIK
jgi:hypothetical protein